METMTTPTLQAPKYARPKAHRGFWQALRTEVNEYFSSRNLEKRGGRQILLKTAALFSLYIGFYLLLILGHFSPGITLLWAILFGLVNVLIVFNIAHDASHNALFNHTGLNRILSFSFNLVGANAYLWNITHNQIHHGFPNVGDYDTDITNQAPLFRVSPTVPRRWFHRYQHLYAPFFYLTYSLFLVFLRDYQDINLLPKKDSLLLENRKHDRRQYLILLFSKLGYYSLTIIIPFLMLGLPWPTFLLGFLIVHAFMSALLIAVLVPVHMVDEATFAVVDEEGRIEDDWAVHVFKNTTDYSPQSKLANLFFGGLNTHLVHHLFPGVCHVHYPALSLILERKAAEYGLQYRKVSMAGALRSHFRLLKRMGREA